MVSQEQKVYLAGLGADSDWEGLRLRRRRRKRGKEDEVMKLDIVGMVSSVLVSAALPFSFKTIGSKESYSQEWNPSKWKALSWVNHWVINKGNQLDRLFLNLLFSDSSESGISQLSQCSLCLLPAATSSCGAALQSPSCVQTFTKGCITFHSNIWAISHQPGHY